MSEGNCPLCGGRSQRRFERHGFWILDCLSCRHRFAEGDFPEDHVQRVYDDDYFDGGDAGYARYLEERGILRSRGRWYARMLSRHLSKSSVLDVGCAAGFWLQGFVDCGWKGRGIEPNAGMAEHARSRLGLHVETTTFEQYETTERFDLVAMIQVVPHFRDPRGAIESAAGLIRPGGHLLIESWDCGSWTARGMGRFWHEYSPPSVLHWFTRAGLSRLAGEADLREVARGRPRKRLSAGHAKSLLRYKYGETAAGRLLVGTLGILPDGLALPYPADDLFWMLLRK